MKKLFLSICTTLISIQIIYAQGVGINDDGSIPNASSMLDVKSDSKGILIPRMTTAQRNAIATPATGLLVFQTDNTAGFYYYNGTAWVPIAGVSDNDWTTSGTNLYNANTGNIGIGTTNPSSKLDVVGGNIEWGNFSVLNTDQGGSIELGGSSAIAGTGSPFIDFHFNGLAQDFNTRIINDANGQLTFFASTRSIFSNGVRMAGLGTSTTNTTVVTRNATGDLETRTLPANVWDGDDNTTYTASNGISLTGTNFTNDLGTSIESSEITNGTIVAADINQMGATANQVLTWNGTAWAPATPAADNDWTVSGTNMYPTTATNIGIGTTTPLTPLHVATRPGIQVANFVGLTEAFSTGRSYLTSNLRNTAGGWQQISATAYGGGNYTAVDFSGGNFSILMGNNPTVAFTTHFRMDNAGNIGLGNTTPEQRLDLRGEALQWGNRSLLGTDQGGSIELGGSSAVAGTGSPFIDFHFNGLTQDFNTRIINDGNGQLSLVASNLRATTLAGTGNSLIQTNATGLISRKAYSGTATDVLTGDGNWTPITNLSDNDWTTNGTALYNANTGNVGIGTTTPSSKLDVVGGNIEWGNNSVLNIDQGGSIELGGTTTLPGTGSPFIDFHFNGLAQDFNTRIQNNANGQLTFFAPTRSVFSNGVRMAGIPASTTNTAVVTRNATGDLETRTLPTNVWDGDDNTTYTAGTGMSLVGTTFNNTAPDQTVSLTGTGATTVSGTYPNFTINSTDNNTTYTASNGISLTGTNFTNDLGTSIESSEITNGTIVAADINQMGATNNQVLTWNGTAWAPATPAADNDWTVSGSNMYPSSATMVGIGTATPLTPLHVQTRPGIQVANFVGLTEAFSTGRSYLTSNLRNTTGGWQQISTTAYGGGNYTAVDFSGGNFSILMGNNPTVAFNTYLRMDNNGFIGLNNTTPETRLDLRGEALQWGNRSLLGTDQGGSIELGGSSAVAGTGSPFIDFHFNGITQDFNTRIQNNANGQLTFFASTRSVFSNGVRMAGIPASTTNTAVVTRNATGDLETRTLPANVWDGDDNTTYTAGTGMSLVGTTFNNTAPDQTVSLTGTGATTVSGTYPNFTINSTDNNTTYTASNGISLTGTNFTNDLGTSIESSEITNGTIVAADINQMGATNNQVLTWNGTAWAPATPDKTELVDLDGDTKIDVELTPDEDIIRFIAGGVGGIKITGTANNNPRLDFSSNGIRIGLLAGDAGIQTTSVFIGESTGRNNTAAFNTMIGYQAGRNNTTGQHNTFLGMDVGFSNSTGLSNTFIGSNAGRSNTTSSDNTFVGSYAGRQSTGFRNTFIGSNAGTSNTTGSYNTFVGALAGQNNTLGEQNLIIGYESGLNNSTGAANTFMGYRAGYGNTIGGSNTIVGNSAGYATTSGSANVFMGSGTGRNTTTGRNNTYIGTSAGFTNSTGQSNVFIGNAAGYNETGSNKLYIENTVSATPLIYGDFATDALTFYGSVNVGGNYTLPTADGTNGQVMTTNGTGTVSWSTIASSVFERDATNSDIQPNASVNIASDDFVFGSRQLDNATGNNDNARFYFDKSKAAFRAGFTNGTAFDDANVGFGSTAFGQDNTASGALSSITGGQGNTVLSFRSFIGGGDNNNIDANSTYVAISGGSANRAFNTSTHSTIGGGQTNRIDESRYATISGGYWNDIVRLEFSGIASGRENDIINTSSVRIEPSFIGGGYQNIITGNSIGYSAILGGRQNTISSSYGSISGGYQNVLSGIYSSIAGGIGNTVSSVGSGILSGGGNTVSGQHSAIGAGNQNTTVGQYSFLGAGRNNQITPLGTVGFIGAGSGHELDMRMSGIVGGVDNYITGSNTAGTTDSSSFIVGGARNTISFSSYSFIGSGASNRVEQDYSAVVSGLRNTADGYTAFIGAGQDNTVNGIHSLITGGLNNTVNGSYHAINGGRDNTIDGGGHAAIAGGNQNFISASNNGFIGSGIQDTISISSSQSAIIAGLQNKITAGSDYTFIGAGSSNVTTNSDNSGIVSGQQNQMTNAVRSFIGTGINNNIESYNSVIVGGSANIINNGLSSNSSFIGAGAGNIVATRESFIGAGRNNIATGTGAFVGAGRNNSAAGNYTVALGQYTNTAGNAGCFIFGDNSTTIATNNTAPNQFMVRAAGGTVFYSNAALTSGVQLAAGGGAWAAVSDVNKKENFQKVDGEEVLTKIAKMDIQEWNYITQEANIRHLGPTAQDFHAAFGLGESDTTITTVDIDGVNLLAVQTLEKRTQELKEQNTTLQTQVTAQATEIAQLKALLIQQTAELEAKEVKINKLQDLESRLANIEASLKLEAKK